MQFMTILTNDIIEAGKSSNGGWSQDQLELLNVSWPPTKGWKWRVIGQRISAERVRQFLELKDKHLPSDTLPLFPEGQS